MSVLLLYQDGDNSVVVRVDATTTETHAFKSDITKHPVEEAGGASLVEKTDHIIRRGQSLKLTGIVTDHPITLGGALIGGVAGLIGSQVAGTAGAIATAVIGKVGNSLLSGGMSLSQEAFSQFEKLYIKGTPIIINTRFKSYINMIMESFQADVSAKNGESLEFTASFRPIDVVEGKEFVVPDENKDINLAGKQKEKGAVDATAETSDKKKTSALKHGVKAIKSLFGG